MKKSIIYYVEQLSGSPHIFQYIDLDDLRSNDTWYGMTYKEDVKAVKNSFRKMLEDGMYKEDLFADL